MVANTISDQKYNLDILTIMAIAAVAISLNIAFHEGVHAFTCKLVGGQLKAYSALYVSCECQTLVQRKIVDGSAPIMNILLGTLLWFFVSRFRKISDESWFFLWLFMLMNFLYGSGYLIFSGIANVGDFATVIQDWQPPWLWRVGIIAIGACLFLFFVWLALIELGKMIGGRAKKYISRANRLALISYFTSLIVVVIAGFFNPYGLLSLPVIAGLSAVLGGLSPLLWMMHWFQATIFTKIDKKPLQINRNWAWISSAVAVLFLYTYVLGSTLKF